MIPYRNRCTTGGAEHPTIGLEFQQGRQRRSTPADWLAPLYRTALKESVRHHSPRTPPENLDLTKDARSANLTPLSLSIFSRPTPYI